jgi:hypothetical protein
VFEIGDEVDKTIPSIGVDDAVGEVTKLVDHRLARKWFDDGLGGELRRRAHSAVPEGDAHLGLATSQCALGVVFGPVVGSNTGDDVPHVVGVDAGRGELRGEGDAVEQSHG